MSCIVGINQNNKLWVASDSRATTEDGDIRYIKAKKIYRYKEPEMIIGFAGSVRTGQTLDPYYFTPPENIMDLPNAFRQQFEKYGCLSVDHESGMEITKSNFLIAYQGRLFEILVDFQLNEIDGEYTAIGYGQSYAIASLYTSDIYSENDPEKRINMAIGSACKFTGFCHYPIVIETLDI